MENRGAIKIDEDQVLQENRRMEMVGFYPGHGKCIHFEWW